MTLSILITGCQDVSKTSVTIFKNGKIYTVDRNQPWVESIIVQSDEIVFAGANNEALSFAKDMDAKIVDLEGRFVMPGIHDTHIHFEGFYNAKQLKGRVLRYTGEEKSIDELQAKLEVFGRDNPELELLFVEQLPLSLFPGLSPSKAFIDEVISDRPVVMLSDSEHESLLNSKALELENIDSSTSDPVGGEIVRDSNGEPTGLLREKAAGLWGWKHFPSLTRDQHYLGMYETVKYLNSFGITSAKEQHAKRHWAQAFKDMDDRDSLSMRIGLSWTYKGPLEPSPLDEQEAMIENRAAFSTDLIGVDYVKLSLDGTLGTTGSVVEPYLDSSDSENKGILFYTLEDLVDDVERFDSMGIGITVHANADGAVRQFLDAIDQVIQKNGVLKARHQVGHAITIHPEDLSRFNAYNVTAEFSPFFWFPSAYSEAFGPRLGENRMAHLFPMKSLSRASGRFVLASDAPLFWQGPFPAIESAITRKAPNNESNEVLSPMEKVDLEMVIKAYTINGAYLMNQEKVTGSIEVGKKADFIVLNQNLFEIDPEKISETEVLSTYFNGVKVFENSHGD